MIDLHSEVDKIEILNEDNYQKHMVMEVVDYNQTFGCFIDREENRTRLVSPFKPPFFRNPPEDFKYYMPDSKKLGDMLTLNMEIVVRVETRLKLDLIGRNGKRLVEDDKEFEVHFIRFESVLQEIELSITAIFKMIKQLRKKELNFS